MNTVSNYKLQVFAVNKAGDGANSTAVTCFTAAIPGQPGTPQLLSSTSSSISLRWDPAYDDGGSPLKQYQLYMDEVEGLGVANIENWSLIYTGNGLTYTVSSGL